MSTASPGYKFVILFTLPSGQHYAAGAEGDNFQLIPVEEDGCLRGVLAWDTTEDVKSWINNFRKENGEKVYKKFMSFKPKIGQVIISQ